MNESTNLFFRERILPEDLEAFRERLEFSRQHIVQWDHEFRVLLPKKGLRWMRLSAKPERLEDGNIHFYGRVSDVTEQKEQEQQIKISEERYKFALRAASEGIWDWDMSSNDVYFSAQSMKIIGKDEVDVRMQLTEWTSRMHKDDVEQYERRNCYQ